MQTAKVSQGHPLALAVKLFLDDDDPMLVVISLLCKYFHQEYHCVKSSALVTTCQRSLPLYVAQAEEIPLLRAKRKTKTNVTDYAVIHGYESLLHWAVEYGLPCCESTFHCVITNARPVSYMQALQKRQYNWDEIARKSENAAVSSGTISVLRLLIRYKFTTYERVCDLAISVKQLLVFEWTMQYTHQLSWYDTVRVAKNSETDGVIWLDIMWKFTEKKLRHRYHRLSNYAAEQGMFRLLRWTRENCKPRIPWGDKVLEFVLYGGYEWMVRYCLINGCPIPPKLERDPVLNRIINEQEQDNFVTAFSRARCRIQNNKARV